MMLQIGRHRAQELGYQNPSGGRTDSRYHGLTQSQGFPKTCATKICSCEERCKDRQKG